MVFSFISFAFLCNSPGGKALSLTEVTPSMYSISSPLYAAASDIESRRSVRDGSPSTNIFWNCCLLSRRPSLGTGVEPHPKCRVRHVAQQIGVGISHAMERLLNIFLSQLCKLCRQQNFAVGMNDHQENEDKAEAYYQQNPSVTNQMRHKHD